MAPMVHRIACGDRHWSPLTSFNSIDEYGDPLVTMAIQFSHALFEII
jgi:hypothetical protein